MSELPDKKFNPDALYAVYKQARNSIRRHTPMSVIAHSIDALYKAAYGGVDILRFYQPWNILLLIRWTLQEADSISHRRADAKLNDVNNILNIIHKMGEHVRMPTEFGHVLLFMRHLAFQQFWLQHTADAAAIARQELLFCRLPINHSFQRDFFRITGVGCAEFTQLSLALTAMFIGDPKRRVVLHRNFLTLNSLLTSKALNPFLATLSRDLSALHKIFTADEQRALSISDQIISPTLLINFPLLKNGENLISYFPNLLFRSVEDFIYRTLKNDKPVEFPAKFGPMFERYIEDCFNDANVSFTNEKALIQLLDGSGKCVDFLIVEDDCNVLIESKGVEISHLGRVSHKAEIVFSSLKASVQRAIEQGMEVAIRIRNSQAGAKRFGNKENFLLVLTYDSLNLGSNTEFERVFGQKIVVQWKGKFGDPLPIPIKNLFFLDIDELERLLARVREKQTTMLAALRRAQQNDSSSATHKFSFIQHLESISPQISRLPRLQAAFDALYENCTASLSKAENK